MSLEVPYLDIEIRAGIEIARVNFLKMSNLLCDRYLNFHDITLQIPKNAS